MQKKKSYSSVRFSADTLREALSSFISLVPEDLEKESSYRLVESDDESWLFDTEEEFFAAYRKPYKRVYYTKSFSHEEGPTVAQLILTIGYHAATPKTEVTVMLPTVPRIEEVFEKFEAKVESSRVPEPVRVQKAAEPIRLTIFIGHGRNTAWRDLKDHLTDKQGYTVSAYEVGARAGHTIRDILQDLLVKSSFALLVLTAEDETSAGAMRARQNVIHELGLFQGKLGFPRAIALVEKDVELLSNMDGVQQLRFSKDNIAEVYGDVIATLRREFGDAR